MKESEAFLKNELNVKNIEYSNNETEYVDLLFKPNLKLLGPRLGKSLGDFRKAINSFSSDEIAGLVTQLESGADVEIIEKKFVKDDFIVERKPKGEHLVASAAGITVVLDPQLTPELLAEGMAREVVNRLQNFRKDSGLDVSDRITLQIQGSEKITAVMTKYKDYIAAEVLAKDFQLEKPGEHSIQGEFDIDGEVCLVGITK